MRSRPASRKPKKREALCRFRANRLYTRRQRHALPSVRQRNAGLQETCLRAPTDRVHAVASLQEFFKDSVATAMAKQGVAADDHTAYYVVNLLTLFARPETLYDQGKPGPGLQPLALLLAAAADSPIRENATRCCASRRHLAVRGRASWATASHASSSTSTTTSTWAEPPTALVRHRARHARRARVRHRRLAELAEKFRDFVDVLAEIRDSGKAAAIDMLRLYEVWLRTGSRRAARLLRGTASSRMRR